MVPQVQIDTRHTWKEKRKFTPHCKRPITGTDEMDRVGKVPVITNSVRQELLMDEPNSEIQFNEKNNIYIVSKYFPTKYV